MRAQASPSDLLAHAANTFRDFPILSVECNLMQRSLLLFKKKC